VVAGGWVYRSEGTANYMKSIIKRYDLHAVYSAATNAPTQSTTSTFLHLFIHPSIPPSIVLLRYIIIAVGRFVHSRSLALSFPPANMESSPAWEISCISNEVRCDQS